MQRVSNQALWLALGAIALVGSCGRPPAVADAVQREFWTSLRDLCGQSFEGRVVEATPADSGLIGQPLVLDVWQCYAKELRLAFHIGNDHSRVWLILPSQTGLQLSHRLHAADGSQLAFSPYGGETRDAGSPTTQRFFPDQGTLDRIPASAGSVWTLEVVSHQFIRYRLDSREGTFLLEFDLTHQAHRPPAPWGYTRTRAGETAAGEEH